MATKIQAVEIPAHLRPVLHKYEQQRIAFGGESAGNGATDARARSGDDDKLLRHARSPWQSSDGGRILRAIRRQEQLG